jgi:DNA-binding CsgD family transcriptional regulator
VTVGGPVIGEFPLVGRGLELDRIVSGVDKTGPRAFVLAGAAGVGKSRLAAEAAKMAAELGHATAHVVATRSAASIPFGPFAAFLPASEELHPELLGLLRQASEAIAERAFREGASINRELRDIVALRWCVGGLALAEGMQGHRDEALAAVAELDETAPMSLTMFEADLVGRGRAWASVAAGEMSRARTTLSEAAHRAALSQLWVAEAQLLHDSARLGAPEGTAARLAELAATLDSELIGAFAAHAAALVRQSAPELDAVAEAFETLGAWLLAAEASTAAAVIHRAAGLTRRASASARKAGQLTALCGGVRTPGLSGGPEAERLTRREREVARLAAAGASNKEIAATLYVSARTVENHLQSIYAKLGVTSREELSEALRHA